MSRETDPCTISLRKTWVEELLGQVWIRTWKGHEDSAPEWFPHGLRAARPCLGYGVIDPLELRIDGSQMSVISQGSGKTLAERLSKGYLPEDESYARFLIEQISYGLIRVHEGVKSVHGALTPFNVQVGDGYSLSLWALPATRLELSWGTTDREWEAPYRSPGLLDGNSPTIADDIYSLGMLFARLLFGTLGKFRAWLSNPTTSTGASEQALEIVRRSTDLDGNNRFKSVREMVLALNPESELKELDVKGGVVDCRLGNEAFLTGNVEAALEHFQDAMEKDSMSLTAANNLAVTQAALRGWNEAVESFKRAFQICSHHPVLDTNWGLCLLEQKEEPAAEFWLKRAAAVNPLLLYPQRELCRLYKTSGKLEKALAHARTCLNIDSRCRESRLLMADILDCFGDKSEAASHRRYAEQLPNLPRYFDCLISQDKPPWMLYLQGEDDTILNRVKTDANPKNLSSVHSFCQSPTQSLYFSLIPESF